MVVALLEWTVSSALDSGVIDQLVVSTENKEVAQLAEVPFIRPDNLSSDTAGVVDVALHCISELRVLGEE